MTTKKIIEILFTLALLAPLSVIASGGGGTPPPPPPPPPAPAPPVNFDCGWIPVTYVERLTAPNLAGVNISITSQGSHRISGRTTSGSHSCGAIRGAIINRNDSNGYNTNAYPSQVTLEEVRRSSWRFNTITLVRDNGNSKGNGSGSMNPPTQGTTLAGGQYSTNIQATAPYQERWGDVFNFGINTINNTAQPVFMSRLYSVNSAPLRIENAYDFVFTNQSRDRPCFRTGPSWSECHYVFYFSYNAELARPTLSMPSDPNVGIQISHADTPGALLYPNSPIRARWQAANTTSGTCSVSTAPSVPELTFSNIPYPADRERVIRPSEEIGQFFVDVNEQGNFVERRTRTPLLTPGNYIANASCLLTNSPNNSPGFDDGIRTNALGPVTRLVNATTPFTINGDRVVTLGITRIPPTVDNTNPRARIIARTSNAEAGDTHNYSLQQIPNGYRLLSTNQATRIANANGESAFAWEVEVITEGEDRANIGNSEFIAEMTDNFDNLYTGKAEFTYFGGRGVQEIQP